MTRDQLCCLALSLGSLPLSAAHAATPPPGHTVTPSMAQAISQTPSQTQLLNQHRAQLLQLNRQQQVLLQDQLRCLDRAGSLSELNRCRLIMPAAAPPGMGGWHCPMW